jgi:hypothetical protein
MEGGPSSDVVLGKGALSETREGVSNIALASGSTLTSLGFL